MRATMKALMIGTMTFALLLGLGQAMAVDKASDTDTDNTLGATVSSDPPVITGFDITDASDTSFMHAQLDVTPTTYFFNVTVNDDNGWSDIQWINIRVWFDNESSEISFDSQTTGANYKAVLNYTNAGDLTTPNLGEWNVTEGNIVYTSGSSSIFTNTANQNYTFKLAFVLNEQIRQANTPSNTAAGSYNDLGSWNAEVKAIDSGVTTTNQANTTNVFHEFGVFQFTNVSIASDWTVAATIAPGASDSTPIVTVTHKANRNYTMTVWFDSHLTGPATIDVSNINITADGDADDEITADLSFAGLGEANERYIHGSATTNKTHNFTDNQETTGVKFRIFVPLGTLSGTYTANLTIKVEIPA